MVIASASNLVCSRPCTISDCAPGPVTKAFASSDCTGAVRGYSQMDKAWGVCKNTTLDTSKHLSSKLDMYNDQYEESSTYFGSDDCGGGYADATRTGVRKYYGSCISLSSTNSAIYLADINQSYVSPQRPEENPRPVPTYKPISISCSNPTSCLAYSGQYTAHYLDATCSLEGVRYTVDPTTAMNTCYKGSFGKYVKSRCIGPNTVELVFHYNSDCTRPINSIITGNECGRSELNTTLFCVGSAPAPNIPPYYAPASPSSPTYDSGSATRGLSFAIGILMIILSISAVMA